jgi:hypothetical protein
MFNCRLLQSAPTPGSTSAPAGEEGEIEEVEDGELKDDDDSDEKQTPHDTVKTVFDNRQVCCNVCCQCMYVFATGTVAKPSTFASPHFAADWTALW